MNKITIDLYSYLQKTKKHLLSPTILNKKPFLNHFCKAFYSFYQTRSLWLGEGDEGQPEVRSKPSTGHGDIDNKLKIVKGFPIFNKKMQFLNDL